MSSYGQYIKEREGYDIVESEKGFATYKIQGEEAYIRDLYTHPDYRHDHVASQFADQIAAIAKEAGCTYLTGTVCPGANGATQSLKVLLAYGFQLLSSQANLIIFKKDLG